MHIQFAELPVVDQDRARDFYVSALACRVVADVPMGEGGWRWVEVGLRGAKTAAHTIQPDIAFGVDVGIAGDTPGISEKEAQSKIGEGPQIILYDASMVSHKGLRDLVVNTAEEAGIPYQFDSIAGGGTDSGSIHFTANGVPALSITIATRYIHTHAAILHRDDYENTVKLITEVIKKLDRETVDRITYQ